MEKCYRKLSSDRMIILYKFRSDVDHGNIMCVYLVGFNYIRFHGQIDSHVFVGNHLNIFHETVWLSIFICFLLIVLLYSSCFFFFFWKTKYKLNIVLSSIYLCILPRQSVCVVHRFSGCIIFNETHDWLNQYVLCINSFNLWITTQNELKQTNEWK